MSTGMRCLFIDSRGYSTNIDDTVTRTRLISQHAQFVVADISYSEDNPNQLLAARRTS